MANNSQNGSYFPGMRRNRDISAIILLEHVVKHGFRPRILSRVRLSQIRTPERICLGEVFLKGVRGIVLMDVGLATSTITCVRPHRFAEELLDFRYERVLIWKIETGEGNFGGLETAG